MFGLFSRKDKRSKEEEKGLSHVFYYRQNYWDALENWQSMNKHCDDPELVIIAYDQLELAKRRLDESVKEAKINGYKTTFEDYFKTVYEIEG